MPRRGLPATEAVRARSAELSQSPPDPRRRRPGRRDGRLGYQREVERQRTARRSLARHRRPAGRPRRRAAAGRLRRELARGNGRGDRRARVFSAPAPGAEGNGGRPGRTKLARRRQHGDVHHVPTRAGLGPALHPHHQSLLRARREDDHDARRGREARRGGRAPHPGRHRPQSGSPGEPLGVRPPAEERRPGLRVPAGAPARENHGRRRHLGDGGEHQPRPSVVLVERGAERRDLRRRHGAATRAGLRGGPLQLQPRDVRRFLELLAFPLKEQM